ncbi:MAG: ribosome recycling factor [Gammaproteobacteria bacterium]|nr:MAG: ribosome recycling factor [Gammaproteobacteria bacterium]
MINEIKKDAEARMGKSLHSLKGELSKLRTGRANTALLDHVLVDYYGQKSPLNQVAGISVSDAQTLTVAAWEKPMVPVIEKAIMESGLGLNPVTAGEVIRVPIPPLTEDRRKEMVKIVRQEGEGAKIAIRNIRRDALGHIKELLKEKEITEDEDKRAHDDIQKITDRFVAEVDAMLATKEKDLMEV